MVRTTKVVYAKQGTVSSGGLKYTPVIGPQRMKFQVRPNMRQQVAQNTMARAEVKGVGGTLDHTPILATTNTNGSSFVINLVQQGAGSWNRVGRKIRMKSLRIKGLIRTILTTAMQNQTVRMVCVYDKQPSSGAIPTFDTIFGETDQLGAEGSGFLYNVRYDNTLRFSVLKDKVITTDFNIIAGERQTYCDEYIKLKGLETVFSGQSNPMTIADISTGAIYVYFRAEANAAGILSSDVVNSTYRLRYYD